MNVPTIWLPAADELAPQLAVNHVAALVGPDAAALHACAAVGEADRLRPEPDRRPLRPVSSIDPVSSKMAARSSGPRRSVRRVPAAVHVPSNACHSPARSVCGTGPPGWPHAAASRKAASNSNGYREIISLPIDQLLERLRDGEHLIRPHARAGERGHATDGGDALGLGLEHHQVERLLAMAARAASHQEEAVMRSNSPGEILAPGWVCMRSTVRWISAGSIDTVTPRRRVL